MTLNIFRPDRVNPFAKPPKSPEDQIKFDQLKARKARKQNRLREKNVVNSFKVANSSSNDDYDLEKVLNFIGEKEEKKKNTKK